MKQILTLFLLSCIVGACADTDVALVWGDKGDRYAPEDVEQVVGKTPFGYPVWRGENARAQAFLHSGTDLGGVELKVSDLKCGSYRIPSGSVKASFMEYVMADVIDTNSYGQCGFRKPGEYDSLLVADIIDIAVEKDVPAGTVQPVWVSVEVPLDAVPGVYSGKLTVSGDNFRKVSLPFVIEVADRVLPEPSEWKFHLDLWQNPYSVARYHDVELWSKEHFDLMRPVMEILAAAGQKSVTATILDKPWNGQTQDAFGSMVVKTLNPDGSWTYDYTVFDRWVGFMEEAGIDRQINCYSMIPWALKFDYIDGATGEVKYVEAAPGSAAYRSYWSQFIADFAQHLRDKGWFGKTMIAMDERPLDAMQAALDVIKSVEPEFKVSLAGNYHPEIEKDLYDLCIAFRASYPEDVLARRHAEGKVTTLYTCCAEAYPNMFIVSPPYEAAWLAWRALATDCDGYLRWAYNSWTTDPLKDGRFRQWPAGDCFMVYPEGRSSIRMEMLTEGIQDYEKVRILASEWTASGDMEKLEALGKVLEKFTFEELTSEGAEKAVSEARAFIAENM